jgi:hypothetical protein
VRLNLTHSGHRPRKRSVLNTLALAIGLPLPVAEREEEKMKTKLMVLVLMAGGSMFAANHVSFGVNVGVVDPACAPQAYNGYTYVRPGFDGRYDFREFDRDHDRGRDHNRDGDRARVRNDYRGYSNEVRHR